MASRRATGNRRARLADQSRGHSDRVSHCDLCAGSYFSSRMADSLDRIRQTRSKEIE